MVLCNAVGQCSGACQGYRVSQWNSLLQRMHPVQVRVYRDQSIDKLREERANALLADDFPGLEGDVLPHIGR